MPKEKKKIRIVVSIISEAGSAEKNNPALVYGRYHLLDKITQRSMHIQGKEMAGNF
jgi:hypothetical protein